MVSISNTAGGRGVQLWGAEVVESGIYSPTPTGGNAESVPSTVSSALCARSVSLPWAHIFQTLLLCLPREPVV